MTPERKNLPSMQEAATYRIRVRGYLDECWTDCMRGLKVVEHRGTGNSMETILEGEVADQAALTGVLNTLYQLHLPVVSARFLADDSPERKIRENRNIPLRCRSRPAQAKKRISRSPTRLSSLEPVEVSGPPP